jgi:hypothetical protein
MDDLYSTPILSLGYRVTQKWSIGMSTHSHLRRVFSSELELDHDRREGDDGGRGRA